MKVSVSQLNAYVKQTLMLDPVLNDLTVSGEISGIRVHSSGHIYFTLKDESASIRCAFFKPHTFLLKFKPEDGMRVLARGRVSLYERDGQYQLTVMQMEQDGEGALFQAFEQLKEKLRQEGLFDQERKKPIPAFVKKIGVATSPTGAVIRDIVQVSSRRCPGIQIVLAPVAVQGKDAPRSLCTGIRLLDGRDDIDVIIVARGGGSMEDLWCFNDEDLARTIASCRKPVISAVGHETDFTISDFVADLRAPTPSAAAELAVFDYYETLQTLEDTSRLLNDTMERIFSQRALCLLNCEKKLTDPHALLEDRRRLTDQLMLRLVHGQEKRWNVSDHLFEVLCGKMDALSPLKVLRRGYAVAKNTKGKAITSPGQVQNGEMIDLILAEGKLRAEVQK